MEDIKALWQIKYDNAFNFFSACTYDEKVDCMVNEISHEWSAVYRENSLSPSVLSRFDYEDFTFIFDDTEALIINGEGSTEKIAEGRVVAAFGKSRKAKSKRNKSRSRGYLGPTAKAYERFGPNYDKGHFLSHSSGGPLEINLFPQKMEINRGRSPAGSLYCKMEKFIANNPDTFVFSRPIYNDLTLRPVMIELGYIRLDGVFVFSCFENM